MAKNSGMRPLKLPKVGSPKQPTRPQKIGDMQPGPIKNPNPARTNNTAHPEAKPVQTPTSEGRAPHQAQAGKVGDMNPGPGKLPVNPGATGQPGHVGHDQPSPHGQGATGTVPTPPPQRGAQLPGKPGVAIPTGTDSGAQPGAGHGYDPNQPRDNAGKWTSS